MTPRPIVVGVDGSEGSEAALRWALDRGARTDTPVTLVYGFSLPMVAGPAGLAPAVWPDYGSRDEAENLLNSTVERARQSHPGVTVNGTVVAGDATASLVESSRQSRLVVVGARGSGGFTGLLVGSTSVAVSANAHCPVVIVRGDEPPADAPVFAGVDGSEGALLALEFGFAEAAARGVSLQVVHVWSPPPMRWRPPAFDLDTQLAEQRAETAELVEGWREKYPKVSTNVRVMAGKPAEVLIDVSHEAQLLAVGSRGLGGFRGLLLGSTSHPLLYHARCPVAVVRELPN
ncbi:universal stress protein [Phytohabitans flavus]|uniref:Universal stress protein n=1 Tax=Phytohabitans flavus TaxID=1076124 RepID=A0A6F8XVU6_9ACTN|nr:universal stress protein [Phytohabitans flavus]BCB77964.1 universal stress protein [Phytohabitans flavus]